MRYWKIIGIVTCTLLLGWGGWTAWHWHRTAPLRAVQNANAALYARMTALRSDWSEGCAQAALTPTLTNNMLPYGTFADWGVAHSASVICTQDSWLALTCKLAPGTTLALTDGKATTGLINVAGSPRTVIISADSVGCVGAD